MAKILIAEKNLGVRCLLEVLCEHLGHETTTWSSVHGRRNGGPFDLAIIEPAVPEALGLARYLREVHPDRALVFLSTEAPNAETKQLEPHVHLVKPASLKALQGAIEAALASASRASMR